ncbi:hypothetical protein [Falsiroseomonas sp. CW058]|uniref:hypothetical protein n=1 Tax=Falsiroseomonas sp. CW058 TaxID=3388664 RepID=UPI003D31AD92
MLAACSSQSEVAELSPGVFGLTSHSASVAAAARLGVERARGHCAAQGLEFEVVRSAIGASDYQIAFRCPRPTPGWLTPPEQEANSPAFRVPGGLP